MICFVFPCDCPLSARGCQILTNSLVRSSTQLLSRYAPFIYKWRWIVVIATTAMTTILGALAYTHFSVSEQALVVFDDKWNLGRVTTLYDKYFKDFSSFITDDGAINSYRSFIKDKEADLEQAAIRSVSPFEDSLFASPTTHFGAPLEVPVTVSVSILSNPPSALPSNGSSALSLNSPLCLNDGIFNNLSITCECKIGFTGNACELPTCPAIMKGSDW
mmetsp:Transcript_7140/g.10760  ORF Transcript_7140/g.10760 Transcript_7140/m.10760 type:complete len:218 (-) Transcript_7140:1101-1754(-)